MKTKFLSKAFAMILAVIMLVSVLPVSAFAALVDYTAHDSYYKVITKEDYELAPGIVESEIVLNNTAGSQRQVAHVVEVDLSNPYTKVIPSYKGMVPTPGSYGVQIMSEQAKYAEENGYGNVVAAMNLSLSWYDSAYYKQNPHLVGEPLGYTVLNGELFVNSQGKTAGAQTCVVINFDEKDGEARPADMPKVEIRSTASAITGWEEQVIPANFGFLVKDGKNQYSKDNNANNGASRSFVGVKADGTFVMVMNDGRQAPYSTGFTNYEMAEFMLSLGCVAAVNGDGGGSSAFLSQRPGEELKINCSPSDGAERPTTHGILVISTAPATGEFARANITADHDYYIPGSTVKFSALGTDLVGTATEIPADATWQLADPSMGTIENGVFISNGKVGVVTAQMVWNGNVVGEASVEIVEPEVFKFAQKVIVVPFDATVNIAMTATIHGGIHEVFVDTKQVDLVLDNTTLGTLGNFTFTSVPTGDGLESVEGKLTARIKGTDFVAEAKLKLGEPSRVLYDFESSDSIDAWKTGVVNGYHTSGFKTEISYADKTSGQVHNGEGALRLETNGLSALDVSAGGYAQVPIYLKDGIIVKDALSIGFWVYIPDEYENCWIRVLYWYDSDGNGTYDKKNTITVINQPEVYNTWDESGWKYFSVDVSAYSSILIPGVNDSDDIFPKANHPNKGSAKEPNDYRFIEFMFPHTNTNDLWKNYGSINGPFTIYIDNITADFSEAVDDREAPIFKSPTLLTGNDAEVSLEKYSTPVTSNNVLNVTVRVSEDETKETATGLDVSTAKAYVDGVEVGVSYANGRMSIDGIAVADGVHRVKFEICDRAGNKSTIIRLIEVKSGIEASTVQVVPADPTLDRLYGGSVYWMNVNASQIETIQSVTAVIDLNSTNHWELDHMVLAEGFAATYAIDAENNTATIIITRTGENTQTGAATLAQLPIRVIYYDTDIQISGYTAETYWNSYDFWPYDLKVDVDLGVITYVEGYVSNVLNTFSNKEFSVDTEMYTASAGMDPAFKAARGTAHVHTAIALDDCAATCTQNGYTGRTFCEVCNSVVEWGTIVPAVAEHSYDVIDGKLTCIYGNELFNGVYTDGKTYIDGVAIADGWDGDSYYLNGEKLVGVHMIDGKYYEFDENGICPGKLPKSLWYTNEAGESFYLDAGVPMTQYTMINSTPTFFDDLGVAYEGEFEINGEICVFEQGAFIESTTAEVLLAGRCGPKANFVLYANGTLYICGEGATWDYVSVGTTHLPNLSWKNRPWGNQNNPTSQKITKIIIGKDITTIGIFSFQHCYNVKAVEFEEGSSLNEIKRFAFHYLNKVTNIVLPDGVTIIGDSAFGYCKALKTIQLPELATSIHASAFNGAYANMKMNVVEGTAAEEFAKAKNYAYETRAAIYGPDSIYPTDTLVAEGTCGENATWKLYESGKLLVEGSGAIADYKQSGAPWYPYYQDITTVIIGKDITVIGKYAFAHLYNLKNVYFREGSKLTTLNDCAFHYARKVTGIKLPETVTSIGSVSLGYGAKMTYVYIPEAVTSIHNLAFLNPGANLVLDVVEGSIAEDFAKANNLAYTTRPAMYGPDDIMPSDFVVAEGTCGESATWKLYASGKLLVDGSGVIDDYKQSGAPWYAYYQNINTLIIGKDITVIGKYAFAHLYNLKAIYFQEGSKLTTLNDCAFHYARKVTEIKLPETVTSIGSVSLGYGAKLEYVYIPEGITSIHNLAFLNPGANMVLDVAEGSVAESFAIANNLAYTTRPAKYGPADILPSDVLVAEGTCGENATWKLYESGKLLVEGSGAIDDYKQSGAPWYAYYQNINTVIIGKDITVIGKYAFAHLYNLTAIYFQEGSKLTTLNDCAFHYARKVTEIKLPETVTSIGSVSLGYGAKLTYVYIPEGVTSIHNLAFLNPGANLVLDVAAGSVAESFAIANNLAYTTR